MLWQEQLLDHYPQMVFELKQLGVLVLNSPFDSALVSNSISFLRIPSRHAEIHGLHR